MTRSLTSPAAARRRRLAAWALLAQLPLATAVPAGPRPDRALSPDPMEDAYRRALRDWAAGDHDRAAARGAGLLLAAGADPGCREWLQLHGALALGTPPAPRSEIAVRGPRAFRGPAAPEALWTILDFHLAVHGRLVTAAATGASAPPHDLLPAARSILDLYLAAPAEPGAAERAASGALAAAAVARRVPLEGSLTTLRDHLEWTLELAPGDPTALAGLAEAEEALGRYRRAAERFAEVAVHDPDDPWARFGLAFNRLRSGAEIEGAEALAAIAADPAAGWARPLAFQELARHARAAGRHDQALRLLREGVAAIPDDPQLAILLARSLEPDREAAEAALARALAGPPRPSPRLLYDLGPDRRFGAAVARFTALADERAPLLLEWLERIDDSRRQPASYRCRFVEPPP